MKIRGIEINLHPNEDLSNHIRRERDFFECDILDYLKDYHEVQETIVDAGANIGNHSLYFANFLKYESMICFEPIPENFRLLELNLTQYPDIKLYQLALSDNWGTLRASPDGNNMGASRIREDGTIDVSTITLDSLNIQHLTLLKIDVEYHEPQLLVGAKNTIYRCHPLILIEDTNLAYAELLPNYELERGWPEHSTYLYKWKRSK